MSNTLQLIRKRREKAEKDQANLGAQRLSPDVLEVIRSLNSSQPEVKTKKAETGSSDYLGLCKAHQKKFGGTLIDAMREVERIVPNISDIHEKYIEQENAERNNIKNAPHPIEKVDGKDFKQMVSHLKLTHGITTLEAHRHIDREWPALLAYYLEQSNK